MPPLSPELVSLPVTMVPVSLEIEIGPPSPSKPLVSISAVLTLPVAVNVAFPPISTPISKSSLRAISVAVIDRFSRTNSGAFAVKFPPAFAAKPDKANVSPTVAPSPKTISPVSALRVRILKPSTVLLKVRVSSTEIVVSSNNSIGLLKV